MFVWLREDPGETLQMSKRVWESDEAMGRKRIGKNRWDRENLNTSGWMEKQNKTRWMLIFLLSFFSRRSQLNPALRKKQREESPRTKSTVQKVVMKMGTAATWGSLEAHRGRPCGVGKKCLREVIVAPTSSSTALSWNLRHRKMLQIWGLSDNCVSMAITSPSSLLANLCWKVAL